jgi:hypothetical protein
MEGGETMGSSVVAAAAATWGGELMVEMERKAKVKSVGEGVQIAGRSSL